MRKREKGRNGFALVYVTMTTAFLLLPMGGLAIDFGVLYNVKARLQTACDAAVIGAGYLLHSSTDLNNPTQVTTISSAAQTYFDANYPTHYFGTTVSTYNCNVSQSPAGKTITVTATATVPSLFLRVLKITNSQVSATATSNVRYINMMLVVDRSGSVLAEGASATIQSALSTFVANSSTSYLVDGVDTVGMISFGGSWYLDYSPTTHFQTGGKPISTAISNLAFNSLNSTNTGEGLFQAWTQLYMTNLPSALNVIVLLTDGRPSSFTGSFTPSSSSSCSPAAKQGVMSTFVNLGSAYPFWPPPTSASGDVFGVVSSKYQGSPETSYLAPGSPGCAYAAASSGQFAYALTNASSDFNGTFPSSVGPVDRLPSNKGYHNAPGTGISTQTGYYTSPGTSMSNPQAGRYAAFNYADNIATLIRQDTTLQPMIFVVGLNYTDQLTEPLDADWLARVANDPNYVTVGSDPLRLGAGHSVYQPGQTPGMYCNSTPSTLSACFAQVSDSLLRLTR